MDFNLQQGMIDTHFHGLIMENKGIDTKAAVTESFSRGMDFMIDIGTGTGDLSDRINLLSSFDKIFFTAGNYPSEVENGSAETLTDSLEKAILNNDSIISPKVKVAGIGEIGLDWHWNYGTKKLQMELFEAQIALANKYNLPVIIHNREADREILEVLRMTPPKRGGIMHCFSSDYPTASGAMDFGLSISFAGNITYKRNNELREVASKIPQSAIFIETDSPYLSPQQVRGKQNHPGHIGYTYKTVAECLNIPVNQLIQSIQNSFKGMFNPE